MAQMVKCISHGWDPLIDTSARHSWPPFHRNLTSAAKFFGSVSDQMAKYESSFAVHPCAHHNPTSDMVVWNAMGVVIRSSDLDRARVATGIRVTDQASLDAANSQLLILDVPLVKPRLMSSSGVNAHAMTPSFHMGCLDDLVHFITPGCFIATADISSYYNKFPLAESARRNFAVFWLATFLYWVISFGFGPAPYYCST